MVWKDPVIVQMGESIHVASFRDMMVMRGTKDLLVSTISFTALMNAFIGLFTAIDLLIHPYILSAHRVQGIVRHLLNIYSNNNGKTDPDNMAEVFYIRVQQHV